MENEEKLSFDKIFEDFKKMFLTTIIKSIEGKVYSEEISSLTNQLLIKYHLTFNDFSINNHKNHLPELLGYALKLGFNLGAKYREGKLLKEQIIEQCKREFEKRYDNSIYS